MGCDLYFAPLQGYTEDAYRRIHHELCGGIKEYCTPFIRLENGGIRSKDIRDINPAHNNGIPVAVQLIAKDDKELHELLKAIDTFKYNRIDINMGCPFPLQTRHGRGSGILPYPEKVESICKVIKSETERNKEQSFSIKMRLGLSQEDEWKSILPILNDTPLQHITLHPRVGEQQYKGNVNMAMFEEFLINSKHRVIYNGDVTSLDEIKTLQETYHLAGIMLGRGLLARPTLAKEYCEGKEMDKQERLSIIRLMHDRLLSHYETVIHSESQRLSKIRTFWDYMEEELDRKVWKKIMKAGNMKNYIKELPQ